MLNFHKRKRKAVPEKQSDENIALDLGNGVMLRMIQNRYIWTVSAELGIELEKHELTSVDEADALMRRLIQKYDAYAPDDISDIFN